MGFFFLAIYYTAVLLRPQEWAFLPFLYETRLMFYTLILALVGWVFSVDKFQIPVHSKLLATILVVIVISAGLNGWLGGGIMIYMPKFFKTALIPFTLMATLVNSTAKQKVLMVITIISALVMVSNGVSQYLNNGIGWAGSTFARGTTRITYIGTFHDPNDMGMLIIMTIPMVFYFFVRGGFILKLIMVAALAFLIQGVVLTDSRGTLLGLLSIFGLWFLQKYSLKFTIISCSVMVPALMFVLAKFREFDPNEGSAEGRWDAWYVGFDMLKHNPIFGIGFRQFTEEHILTAHNSYVLVFAELGLSGYFLWFSFLSLTMIMLFWVMTHKLPFFNKHKLKIPISGTNGKISPEDDEIFIAKVLFFSIVAYMVTGFFLSRCYMFLIYLFAGMGVASYYRAQAMIPDLKDITFDNSKALIFKMMIGSIVFIYFFTRVMLHWQG